MKRWLRPSLQVIVLTLILLAIVAIDLRAQGPFSAQIAAALRAFLAGNQTITGNWTCTGSCVGFTPGGGGATTDVIIGITTCHFVSGVLTGCS